MKNKYICLDCDNQEQDNFYLDEDGAVTCGECGRSDNVFTFEEADRILKNDAKVRNTGSIFSREDLKKTEDMEI